MNGRERPMVQTFTSINSMMNLTPSTFNVKDPAPHLCVPKSRSDIDSRSQSQMIFRDTACRSVFNGVARFDVRSNLKSLSKHISECRNLWEENLLPARKNPFERNAHLEPCPKSPSNGPHSAFHKTKSVGAFLIKPETRIKATGVRHRSEQYLLTTSRGRKQTIYIALPCMSYAS